MAGIDEAMDVGQISRDLASLKADIGSLMGAIKDMGAEQGRELYSRARDAGEVVRGQAVQTQETVGHYIEERPLTSVLFAFGTGFALGTIVGGRALH